MSAEIKIKEEPLSDSEDAPAAPVAAGEVKVKTEIKEEDVSAELDHLLQYGLDPKVANRVTQIYKTGSEKDYFQNHITIFKLIFGINLFFFNCLTK